MSKNTLLRPYRNFLRETNLLLNVFSFSLGKVRYTSGRNHIFRLSGEMSVIRLHDSWARFCRELVIQSAGCKPYTANGIQLPLAPSIRRKSEVISVLFNTYQRRRFEPKWARPSECIDAARRLNIANLGTVSATIGATNSPAEDLRLVRNFFVHRAENSANEIKAKNLLATGIKINLENTAGVIVTPGVTMMESWIIDLRNIAEAAIQ